MADKFKTLKIEVTEYKDYVRVTVGGVSEIFPIAQWSQAVGSAETFTLPPWLKSTVFPPLVPV